MRILLSPFLEISCEREEPCLSSSSLECSFVCVCVEVKEEAGDLHPVRSLMWIENFARHLPSSSSTFINLSVIYAHIDHICI